jgi:hypothetical protein
MPLTNDRITTKKVPIWQAYPVAAATRIYGGSLVALNATGFAVPAANTANFKVVGIAQQRADNSTGADGALKVVVEAPVRALLKATAITQAMVGATMYVVDDETFDDATGANSIVAGTLSEFVSATSGWLYIAPK